VGGGALVWCREWCVAGRVRCAFAAAGAL
jgi:hypothetical protein